MGAYRSHISRMHKELDQIPNPQAFFQEFDYDTDEMDGGNEGVDQKKIITAQYFLNLETEHRLTQSALNYVITGTETFLSEYSQVLRRSYADVLEEHGHDSSILSNVTPDPSVMLQDFQTTHLRRKFYSNYCRFIPSTGVLLGTKMLRKKGQIKPIEIRAQFVPFKLSLQALIDLPEIQHFIKYPHESRGELMKDICDGSFIQNHPIFSQDKSALMIVANHDDLDLCNPLGVHVKKNKQAAFYYTLGNIPPQYRSRLHTIQLIGLGKTRYIKEFGGAALLKDFVDGIEELRTTGIELKINGQKRTFRGDLIIVPCDTPAAAWLGGFKEGVAHAKKGCRTCEGTQHDMRTRFTPNDFVLRNSEEHKERCDHLSALSKKARKHWSKFWGVNFTSPLIKITSSLSDLLPHDPMHVLLEGIVPYEFALCLYEFILVKKYFTLNWLNSQIANFPFQGTDISQKPVKIEIKQLTTSFKLKQTSAGMLTLSFILPQIIGSRIPDDDKHYKNMVRLIHIVQLGTCPYATTDTAGELEQLIAVHHYTFVELYPKQSVTPKFHYLVHFPRQILQFGPLRTQWVMRYEGKNGFFSRYVWKNFKNLEYSMADKHQLSMCCKMLAADGSSSSNFLYLGDIVEEGVIINFDDLNMANLKQQFQDKCQSMHIAVPFPLTVYECHKVNIHGHVYIPGFCLLFSWNEFIPKFVVIRKIIVLDDRKFFLCQVLQTVTFHWKLNSYEVTEEFPENNIVIHHLDLENPWPLHLHIHDNKKLIVNRYCHFTEYID